MKHQVRLLGFDVKRIAPPSSMGLGDIKECLAALEAGSCYFKKLTPHEVLAYRKEIMAKGIEVSKTRKKRADAGSKRSVRSKNHVTVSKSSQSKRNIRGNNMKGNTGVGASDSSDDEDWENEESPTTEVCRPFTRDVVSPLTAVKLD